MSIVSVFRLIFDVRDVYRDASSFLFRGIVNVSIFLRLGEFLISKDFGYCRSQSSFAVVYMSNGTYVAMWLGTFIYFFLSVKSAL